MLITRANKVQEWPFQPLLGFTLEPQYKYHKGWREVMARGTVEIGRVCRCMAEPV